MVAMAKILLVEDEEKIREKIAQALQREGYDVDTLGDEKTFSPDAVARLSPRVLVLDRLLGRFDTLSSLSDLKSRAPETAILVLSAIDSPIEKAKALDAGADDYLAKPFSMTELLARVKALQRRASTPVRALHIDLGGPILDLEARTLLVNGKRHHLTNKEFGILRLLAESPGRVYGKQQILERVWDVSADVESNAVEAAITGLRRRLEEMKAGLAIKNMRNAGYWLETESL